MLAKWIHLQRRVKEATFPGDTDRRRFLKAYLTLDLNLVDSVIDIGEVCFRLRLTAIDPCFMQTKH